MSRLSCFRFSIGGGRGRGRSRARNAFTLVELLTVMGLIVILMSLVVGAGVFAHQAAMRAKAKADIEQIHKALQEYQLQYRRFNPGDASWKGYPYPTISSADATELKYTAVTNFLPATITFRDPWQRPYQYLYDTNQLNTYTLYSFGAKKDISEDDIYSGR